MRTRFIIFILVILTVVLSFIFLERPTPRQSTQEQSEKTMQVTNSPENNLISLNQNVAPVAASTNVEAIQSKLHNQLQTPEGFQKYVEGKNFAINFFGQVVDQDGKPIEDAKIKAQAREWYVTPSLGEDARFPSVATTSDADGNFEIKGIKGDGFGIAYIQKDGYELESGQRSFGPVGGSLNSPVIFRMWSTNIHEQLITGEKSFHIVPDGRPYVIDLIKGIIAESGAGDLKIWVKRPDQITYGKRYDWSCEADVLNGGLLAETDASSSMYMAPADGYAPSFQFEQKVGSGWGDSTGPKRFYIRLNNGQEYGRVTIELFAYYNNHVPGLVRIQYVINSSGSRILR